MNIDNKRNINEKLPIFEDYNNFESKKHSLPVLKEICKKFKLKVSGNKTILNNRIITFLHNSFYAIKIQKYFKRYIIIKYFKLLGPAAYDRKCKNDTDFFTLEDINKIKFNEFYSYKSVDGSIWGFNIISLYNLFIKSDSEILNPYTREKIEVIEFNKIKKVIKLSKKIGYPVNIQLNDNMNNLTAKKRIEIKCLELFQYIDQLGNYTDIKWFLSLNRNNILKFIYEIIDIWQYRAQLEYKVKKEICYPYGNPFRFINSENLSTLNIISLQKTALHIIEQFVTKGINRDMSNLGASYILCGKNIYVPPSCEFFFW